MPETRRVSAQLLTSSWSRHLTSLTSLRSFLSEQAAKGFASAGAAEMLGGGVGMRVLTREQMQKGQFAGAGIKTKREEM